jgi:hypothetical protein
VVSVHGASGPCDEFPNLFGQNFKISQIVNSIVTLQENKFKCSITLVIIKKVDHNYITEVFYWITKVCRN